MPGFNPTFIAILSSSLVEPYAIRQRLTTLSNSVKACPFIDELAALSDGNYQDFHTRDFYRSPCAIIMLHSFAAV
jgi:hypothetical protein